MTDLDQQDRPTSGPADMWWTQILPPQAGQPATDPAPYTDEAEAAVALALAPGWSELADAVIDRSEQVHGTDRTDWGRLQIGRNLASAALSVLVPVHHGSTAAGWVAHAIATGGITAPVSGPAGAGLAVAGSLWLGRLMPGPLGAVCGLGAAVLARTASGVWRFVRSPRGWLVTRPLIWAVAGGVLIVSWRVIVHTLTGA